MHTSIKARTAALLLFFASILPFSVSASHIVGGGFTYRYLGDTVILGETRQKYQVTLELYQDCLNGVEMAITVDNPVYIAIYEVGSTTLFLNDEVYYDPNPNSGGAITIPPTILNSTSGIAYANLEWCLLRKRFTKTYYLPKNSIGYVVTNQRCCRNANILNIIDAGNVGITLSCTIPPSNTHNNSAVFSNYPPAAVCINKPMVFYDTATDADGDSLSYEFCSAYTGAASLDIKPKIPFPPPYNLVNYAPLYSTTTQMTGQPGLLVEAVSGIMTATPDRIGRYAISKVCKEWRNGQMLNATQMEFELQVINCDVIEISNITAPNVFTPNGDGYNDVFRLLPIGKSTLKNFRVYNRWGNMMFHSSTLTEGWDGTYKGKEQDPGVYSWAVEYDDNTGTTRVTGGNVTLLR